MKRIQVLRQFLPQAENLLAILHALARQNPGNDLTRDDLTEVAHYLSLPLSRVQGVVTFYSMYSLVPRGSYVVRVCQSPPCHLMGGRSLLAELSRQLGIEAGQTTADGRFTLETSECLGHCEVAPAMQINEEVYGNLTAERVAAILEDKRRGSQTVPPTTAEAPRLLPGGKRIVLDNVGGIHPERIEDSLARGGYDGLKKALSLMPEQVIALVGTSGLRGRGGAGFPTGLKWKFAAKAVGAPKYIVCNADEGEPGTFKDRPIMEGDPHKLVEGIIIAGYAIGAGKGYIYVRGEYALSIQRLRKAIADARRHGFLGSNVLGSGFDFELEVKEGAGAYVCGEETALIDSLEGKRGQPRVKPPYPANVGVYNLPTAVNNVETLANVPGILLHGADWFRSFGTEACPGTKIYLVMGDVNHPGFLEADMGTTLSEIIDGYGGGIKGGRKFKAALVGGAAGMFLGPPALSARMDFDAMKEFQATLGSGSVLVMDETRSLPEMLWSVLHFFQHESCGKCTPCRAGCPELVKIGARLKDGNASAKDLDVMLNLSQVMWTSSLCPLGQSLIMPVKSALDNFGAELRLQAQ